MTTFAGKRSPVRFTQPLVVAFLGAVFASGSFAQPVSFTLQQVLNPFPAVGDGFGMKIAPVGDAFFAVAARDDDAGAIDAGSAYLFDLQGKLVTTFHNPSPEPGDHFGNSVAGVGSDRVLIGADRDDTGATDAGSAYLFDLFGNWILTFTNPAPSDSDNFGIEVAGVGNDHVLIGACYEDQGGIDTGVAYLFNTAGTLVTTFTNPAPVDYDYFGLEVKAAGTDRVLIGAPGKDLGAIDAGAAYLFDLQGRLITTFTNPAPADIDRFGNRLASLGSDRVLVGMDRDDQGAEDAGLVYLFDLQANLLTTITNPAPAVGDRFGTVSAIGDDRILVGARLDDVNGIDTGAAYLYDASGSLLLTFTNPTPATGDLFAFGGLAGVGSRHLVIGARRNDTGAEDAGIAYLYHLQEAGTTGAARGVEEWVRRYSHPVDATDVPETVVSDAIGNAVVIGSTQTRVTDYDWLVIKYDRYGVPMWTNHFNGPGNGEDRARAVAVDRFGNVFVTGYSANSNDPAEPSHDFATVAYDSVGVPMWTNLYNGPGDVSDKAVAVAADGNGNVYVTGFSGMTPEPGSDDYATIAYTSDGMALWTNYYDGLGHLTDRAVAMAVDGSGTVFVTGTSADSDQPSTARYDYATVAYASDGMALWTNRYDGPGNDSDEAIAVVAGENGNVVVTGSSQGSNRWYEYGTVAYDRAGVALWTNRYSGPESLSAYAAAMTMDASGNVIVTGYSVTTLIEAEYATVAYGPDGMALWTNSYSTPESDDERGTAVAVDGSGNVYVTGRSTDANGLMRCATVAYSNVGTGLWTNRFPSVGNRNYYAVGVAAAGNGNVYLTGNSWGNVGASDFDCLTVAYNSAGEILWLGNYLGLGNDYDVATAVAADEIGNVYVTGYSIGTTRYAGDEDYATVAYDSEGVALWTNRYDGPARGDDRARAVAVDGNGNVYVTGTSPGNGTFSDYATVAYDSAGAALWTNRYNGPLNSSDEAAEVAVGGNGNVYVTGTSFGIGTSSDYATIAYSAAGVGLWTNRYNGPGNNEDRANAITVGVNENVVVTGSSFRQNGTSSDYATVAYTSGGTGLWTNLYHGPNDDSLDEARAVAVTRLGRVYVTGTSYDTDGFADYATVAYNSAGVRLWANRYNGLGDSHDYAAAVVVGQGGNAYVTGGSIGTGGHADYATVAYSISGVHLWTSRYGGGGNGGDMARAVVVDQSRNVIVTGYSHGNGGSSDYATVAYTGDGELLWTSHYNGPANGDDSPQSRRSIAVTPDGVVVAGASDGDYTPNTSYGPRYDYALVKYVTAFLPLITTQPVSQLAEVGAGVAFSVTAVGTAPLSYQWTFNGAYIHGANSDSLFLADVQPGDSGSYAVVVSNDAGTVTSDPATLLVDESFGWRIATVERIGADLRIHLQSRAGSSYVVQCRTNLSSGSWETLPGAYTGTGDLIEISLITSFTAPQKFYRIKQTP